MRLIAIVSGTIAAAVLLSPPARAQTPLDAVARGDRHSYVGFGIMPIAEYGALTLKAGRVLGDHLLVGVEGGGMYGVTDASTSLNAYADAVVTWFPFRRWGLYLKGGIGYGTSKNDETDGESPTKSGLEVRYGGGWERSLNWHFSGRPANWGVEVTVSPTSVAAGGLFMLVTFNVY